MEGTGTDKIKEMLSTRLHDDFFILLRSGLWGEEPAMTGAPLTVTDWEELYREAVAQTVSGLVYAGISNTAPALMPDHSLLARWTVRTMRIAEYNEKVNKTISSLTASLNSSGIAPVLLKGQATALAYMEPGLRECGDIDFFFQNEKELEAAREIVGRGCLTERKSDGSFVCNRNGVSVELHGKMFDMVTPFQKRCLADAVSNFGFRRIDWPDNGTVELLSPAPVTNMLMQNLHILRHALCFGIGLRQLCDYAVCHRKLDENEKAELKAILDRMGLSGWNDVLTECLDSCLYGQSGRVYKNPLYKTVMETGNFGFASEARSWRRIVSNNVRLFSTVPVQSLTTLFSLFTRR